MTTLTPTSTSADDCRQCEEGRALSGLTRRTLLRGAIAGGAAIALSPNLSVRYAAAATPTGSDTLVVLFLRGGFDGLSAVIPVTDTDYYSLRPTIGIPSASALQLDTRFGLHPALAPLKPLWDNGTFGVVHAAGLTAPNRSHFSAMEEIERAAPGSSIRTGWLDRTLGLDPVPVADEPFRATSFGSRAPQSMAGPNPEVSFPQLSDFTLSGGDTEAGRTQWATALRSLHSHATASVGNSARTTLGALDSAAVLRAESYTPDATYPDSDIGHSLRDAARLIKSEQDIAVITLDVGDWDMHAGLGTVGKGWMFDKLTELGQCLASFMQDLGDKASDVSLVTMSEFGRRSEENASAGVDHGWGNVMMLLGGGIKGGTVYGDWPGLSPDNLFQGDLQATTDYRSVLADLLVSRCGASTAEAKTVFPGWTGSSLGLATARA